MYATRVDLSDLLTDPELPGMTPADLTADDGAVLPNGVGWWCQVCLGLYVGRDEAEACHKCETCGGSIQYDSGACYTCEPLLILH